MSYLQYLLSSGYGFAFVAIAAIGLIIVILSVDWGFVWSLRAQQLMRAQEGSASQATDDVQDPSQSEFYGRGFESVLHEEPSDPLCRKKGHAWDNPEWELYRVHDMVYAYGFRQEFRQHQECKRCHARRLRLRDKEAQEPRVAYTLNTSLRERNG